MSLIKSPNLNFDPENHEYRIEGAIVPSVTQVLGILYDFSREKMSIDKIEEAKSKGTYIHKCCELDDLGELNYNSLEKEIKPYVQAWGKFLEDFKLDRYKPEAIERPEYSQKYMYAGTVDRIWKGFPGLFEDGLLVDIKTGNEYPTYPLQMMAYHQLVYENYGIKPDLITVYLKPDGKYKPKKVKFDKYDFNIFRCSLTVYNWKKNNGG